MRTPEIPASAIWDGNWHAVAGVFDGGQAGSRRVVSLWVDGREVSAQDIPSYLTAYQGDTTLSYPTGAGDDELMIATGSDHQLQFCPTTDYGFAGTVDEAEIFHKALTGTQLATLQDAGAPTPPAIPYTPDLQGRRCPGHLSPATS